MDTTRDIPRCSFLISGMLGRHRIHVSIVFAAAILFCDGSPHPSWPNTDFVLPQPAAGCPNPEEEWFNSSIHLSTRQGLTSTADLKVEKVPGGMRIHFCSYLTHFEQYGRKDFVRVEKHGPDSWSRGQYCVLQAADTECPDGLTNANITVDGQLLGGGKLPYEPNIVSLGCNVTVINYCCSWEGEASAPLRLPCGHPFILYPTQGAVCQQVGNMDVQLEHVVLNDVGVLNTSHPLTLLPHAARSRPRQLITFLCYYTPQYKLRHLDYPENVSSLAHALKPAAHLATTRYLLMALSGSLVVVIAFFAIHIWRQRLVRMRAKPSIRFREADRRVGNAAEGAVLYTAEHDARAATISSQLEAILDKDTTDKLVPHLIQSKDIVTTEKIGQGAFGEVWLGHYSPKGKKIYPVAIKTIKFSCNDLEVVRIVHEALLMLELKHRHLLGLIGITLEPTTGLPQLVMPYMRHRDLQTYLRRFRYEDDLKDKVPAVGQLITFALHVAKGMSYLASMKFVHRDLATRNCMVDGQLVVKVADFGLARDVYTTSCYKQMTETRLPLKWMALESLQDNVFITKSDVWSYGVTLWEIFTLAKTPYPGIENCLVLQHLLGGGRLEPPSNCPSIILQLMSQCWLELPQQRPDFTVIVTQLEDYLSADAGYLPLSSEPRIQ